MSRTYSDDQLFEVAFSFAGENRELVRKVAEELEASLGAGKVFFDEWYEAILAGPDSDLTLQNIYHNRARLVIVCVSGTYGGKLWTQMEYSTIRGLIMKLRTSGNPADSRRVLPLRFGVGDVAGLYENAIVPEVMNRPPADIARLVLDRLNATPQVGRPATTASGVKCSVFISYRRRGPDAELAARIQEALQAEGHRVFRDVDIAVGMQWAQELQRQLHECDVFLPILSERSKDREMVRQEIAGAYTRQRQSGAPLILPVRVSPWGELPPEIGYLEAIQHAFWESEADTAKVTEQLLAAITRGATRPAADPVPAPSAPMAQQAKQKRVPALDVVGMAPDKEPYVMREMDDDLFDILRSNGVAAIRAASDSGKSSMVNRLAARLEAEGLKAARIDMKLLAMEALEDPREAYEGLANLTCAALGLACDTAPFFERDEPPPMQFRNFLVAVISSMARLTVLFLDDLDSLFGKPYQAVFFAGLRGIVESRATIPNLRTVGFAFVHALDSAHWITGAQSPFNVAQKVYLRAFTDKQVSWLAGEHGVTLSPTEMGELQRWLGGHPFLVRIALYHVARGRLDWARLCSPEATDSEGPFADHLRAMLMRITEVDLTAALKQVLQVGNCGKVPELEALRALGLVVGKEGHRAAVSCELYRSYFQDYIYA